MDRIEFSARSGLRLSAELTHADSSCGVIMVHDLMADRNNHGLFPEVATTLRYRGWGSLRFDLSGCGESDDNSLTPDGGMSDLQSAIDLMRSMGYRRLALWGHGLGSRFCLERARGIECMVLTDGLLGRASIDWRKRFTTVQLAHMAEHGYLKHTTKRGTRRHFVVDRSLIDYYATFMPGKVLPKVRCRVLVLHPADIFAESRNAPEVNALMRLLPEGSERYTVPRTVGSTSERAAEAATIGASWISEISPSRPSRWAMAA